MSAAVLEAPAVAAPLAGASRRERRPTLVRLLEDRWRSAHAAGAADCPICAGPMHPDGAEVRCAGCGSTLS